MSLNDLFALMSLRLLRCLLLQNERKTRRRGNPFLVVPKHKGKDEEGEAPLRHLKHNNMKKKNYDLHNTLACPSLVVVVVR